MDAFILKDGQLSIDNMPEPTPKQGEVVVAIKTVGLNRRDLYIPNRVGVDPSPLILGSDGAGLIEKIGAGVTEFAVGDEVIINPSLRWYEQSIAPPEDYDILGMPDHGTFAEKISLPAEQVEPKPAHLSWEEAGVFALSGLTAYRALFTKGKIQAGDTVFIPGAGSGVATYLIQFAKAAGARVIVTSRNDNKREQARQIGAHVALQTNSEWAKELEDETIDLVIDSVGKATFNRSLSILKQGGRFVTFGATTEDVIELDLRAFFYGQYELLGSTMGSREELRSMIQLTESRNIKPIVGHVYPFEHIKDAFALLEKNEQFGKIAINIVS